MLVDSYVGPYTTNPSDYPEGLYKISTDNFEAEQLTAEEGSVYYFEVTPDGEKLVMAQYADLIVVDLDGETERLHYSSTNYANSILHFNLSPDSEYISAAHIYRGSVSLISLDTAYNNEIYSGHNESYYMTDYKWSPDSKNILTGYPERHYDTRGYKYYGSSWKSVGKLMGLKRYNMASNKGKRAFQGVRKSV